MRVLILGLNYLPESTSIGPYTADLAEHLIRAGHEVTVVTGFPMAPQWRVWDGYRGEWFRRETVQGVPIVRSYLYVPEDPRRAWKRVLFDSSFGASALLASVRTGPCDLVVAVSPPLQAGAAAWLVSLMKRAPLFVHLQDLVPDAALATGLLDPNSRAVRLARGLEQFIYRRAKSIGVICEGFRQNLLAKGVPAQKIELLPNYIDVQGIQPADHDGPFRRRWNIPVSDFLVIYSGSIGLKQGLHTLVDAAALLRDERGVTFAIIGDGPSRAELVERASSLGLENIRFLPLQPREMLAEQLAAADALVITQRRAVTDIVFPGKLLYYMAAGRPILAAVTAESETGRFVASNGVGLVTPPEDAPALAEAIRRLRQGRAAACGHTGRAVVERQFDRRIVLPHFVRHLEAVAGAAVRPTGSGER